MGGKLWLIHETILTGVSPSSLYIIVERSSHSSLYFIILLFVLLRQLRRACYQRPGVKNLKLFNFGESKNATAKIGMNFLQAELYLPYYVTKVWSHTLLSLKLILVTLSHHTFYQALFCSVPYVSNIMEGKCKKFGFAFLDSCNK